MKQAVFMSSKSWGGLIAISVLAACTATGGGSPGRGAMESSAPAVRPISQMPASGEAQNRAKVHTELGALYLQDGRSGVALEEAKIAVSADATYAPAHSLQGLIHMMLGENPAAEESFQRALGLASGDPEINNNYGWFLCQTGREREAMRHFQMAYRNPLYRTPTKPYTNAGVCAVRIKDYATAEEVLNLALRYDPSNTLAMYWIGEVYLKTQRYEEAKVRVSDLVRMLEPNAQVVWLGLRVERAMGDREAEMKYATQLRRRFQDTQEYQLLIKGQYE